MELEIAVDALHALAQPTRLELFRLLVQRGHDGARAGDMAATLDVPPATLSFHLAALHHAGLVERRTAGRERIYRARLDEMHALVDYLTENCCQGVECRPSVADGKRGVRAG